MLQKSIGRNITALTPGANVTLNCVKGLVFTLTPDQTGNINATAFGNKVAKGQGVDLIITTSGTDPFVLTFNTAFKSTGTLNTGGTNAKVFLMSFVSDGTTLIEKSRTTAM